MERNTPMKRLRRVIVAGAVALATAIVPVTVAASPAQAAPVTGFNPGNIISDSLFYNGSAMSAAQVQSFLNQRLSSCRIGTPPYMPGALSPSGSGNRIASNCLKDFRQTTSSRAGDAYCSGYVGKANETSAQIIAKVGQACGISQKVLLVMLEKEQSLLTDSWPVTRQYNYALGMNCPDSGPGNSANCDAASAGFALLLYLGARQLKVYKGNPNSFNYKPFQNNRIQWHPNAGCGTSTVYIENWATAALYIYTPYRPNQAALNAGWGTGDGCSSYGNRNFYNFYKSWFGAPTGYTVTGAALDTWNRFGGIDGTLGAPTSAPVYYSANGGGYLQSFSRGVIFTESKTGKSTAMSTAGAFYKNYVAAGYVQGAWGWPTADPACNLAGGGCTMAFQTGVVAYSPATGSRLVPTALLPEWNRLANVNGMLGYPIAAAQSSSAGTAQLFQGGLSMATKIGNFTYNAEVANAWKSQGGMTGFGIATSTVTRPASDRYYIDFERATLFVVPGQSTVRFGSGAFLRAYREDADAWGWPLAAGICNSAGACTMNFDGGQAVYSKATGVVFLSNEQGALWRANGGVAGMGYPIGKTELFADGSMQKYQKGNLVAGPDHSVRFGSGVFLRTWTASGGPEGPWGWPLAAGICNPAGACTMNFDGGQAVYSKATGVAFLSNDHLALWRANGGVSKMGYPIGEPKVVDGRSTQRYQKGSLTVETAGVQQRNAADEVPESQDEGAVAEPVE